jgi:hypothetical protein
MRLGPRTGAGDGAREYKAMSNLRGRDTGSHWKDQQKKDKQAAKREAALEKKRAKKEARG